MEKLHRKNRKVSLNKAIETLRDLAGVRVICSFQDDVYRVAGAIKKLPGYELVKEKNYITKPKSSGYRSIHLILKPAKTTSNIKCIEVQVRSAAMNYWAILEHQLCYKNEKKGAEQIRKDLKECAIDIAKIDKKNVEASERNREDLISERYPFSTSVSIYLSHNLRYTMCRLWDFIVIIHNIENIEKGIFFYESYRIYYYDK